MAATKWAYLGGGITNCMPDEARGWRDDLKTVFKNLINPCDFPWTRQFWEHGIRAADHIIVEGDKEHIDRCDVVLIKYNPDRISWGTAQEQLYAFERGKLTLVWLPEALNLLHVSAWLRYHATMTVHSYNGVINYLKQWGIE